MSRRLLLYTRSENVIRGPFPSKQITRHILLGRISKTDEVSTDQLNWRPVSEFPDLIPPEMNGDMKDPLVQQRLRLARFREDERLAGDRRNQKRDQADSNQRKSNERRTPEAISTTKHREIKTVIHKEGEKKKSSMVSVVLAILVITGIVVSIAYFVKSTPVNVSFKKSCDMRAKPGADWSDCQMEGSTFNQAQLKNSRLRNVNLTGSEITNTDLSGSDLAYGNYSLVNFKYSNLSKTNMLGSVLRKANLSNSNFLDANLSFSVLQEADLSYANLQNADLSNADLSGAIITGANFKNAKLDNTIWVDQRICDAGSIGKCEVKK